MFNNPNNNRDAGYFCCERGLRGYNATGTGGSDGCAPQHGDDLGKKDEWLNQERKATVPVASSSPALPALLLRPLSPFLLVACR